MCTVDECASERAAISVGATPTIPKIRTFSTMFISETTKPFTTTNLEQNYHAE